MSNITGDSPSMQDQYGGTNMNGFGVADSFIDADAFPASHYAPPGEAEIGAMYVAEMERRDREAAEVEYAELQAQENSLCELLRRSIEHEQAKRSQSKLAARIVMHR